MANRIVVPADGSRHSLAAIGPGSVLANQMGHSCEVLSVVTSGDEVAARRETLLAELRRVGSGDVPVEVVVADTPINGLLEHAGEETILCMTTHARGPVRELLLGSVATDVVRRIHRPVVLVGSRLSVYWTGPVRALLVSMDHSSQAVTALHSAVELARSLQAELHLLHVLPVATSGESAALGEGSDWLTGSDFHSGSAKGELSGVAQHGTEWERRHSAEWEYLKEHAEWARQQTGLPVDSAVLQSPHPAFAVTQFADAIPGSLIVTGTHDTSPVRRFGMGSFALSVTRSAGCPVVVVSS